MNLAPEQVQWLRQRFAEALRLDEAMARHTWLRVGGPADAFVSVAKLSQLQELLVWVAANRLPCLVLGGGSNLLVRDGGLRGVVIQLTGEFRGAPSVAPQTDGAGLQAGAALPLAQLVSFSVSAGLAGLEPLAGIPGTVGGALRMNAGTHQGCIADVLRSLTWIDGAGRISQSQRSELGFAYRRLALPAAPAPMVILSACFQLCREEGATLATRMAEQLARRRQSQPLEQASAGCFFKNPPAGPGAGALIEHAGLKGRRIGDAEVSPRHANFIVNRGQATATDILTLAALVGQSVRDRFGIALEPEVQIVGCEAHA